MTELTKTSRLEAVPDPADAPASQVDLHSKACIYVVDDEPTVAELVAALLEIEGRTLDGAAAVPLAERDQAQGAQGEGRTGWRVQAGARGEIGYIPAEFECACRADKKRRPKWPPKAQCRRYQFFYNKVCISQDRN